MGIRYSAICHDCGNEFVASSGGGFFFHKLHCDKCGKEKDISFDELKDLHWKYIKGLPGPYTVATAGMDKFIKEQYPGEPISEKQYHGEIERAAGKCPCSGSYKMDAKPRCPVCKSLNYSKSEQDFIINYD
jgi:hypothetical protein